jgi:hypothetical protein
MSNVSTWGISAPENNAAPPNGAPEGWPPSSVNDWGRETMAAVARWYRDANGLLVSGGSSNAYTLTTNSSHANLDAVSLLCFVAGMGNTGAATLNVDGLGAVPFRKNYDEELESGEVKQNQVVLVAYNREEEWFEWLNPPVITDFPLPRSYLSGLTLGRPSVRVASVAAGECRSTDNELNMRLLAQTKNLDASWVAGNGNGGRASNISLSSNTWYHVFAVDTSAGAIDAGFDTSLTAANLLSDTGGSRYRRIGSVLTDGSSNIINFVQYGDSFLYVTPQESVLDQALHTNGVLRTLHTPLGVITEALIIAAAARSAQNVNMYISPPAVTNGTPGDASGGAISGDPLTTFIIRAGGAGSATAGGQTSVFTNTSSQIRVRFDISSSSQGYGILTRGYIDRRGRDD